MSDDRKFPSLAEHLAEIRAKVEAAGGEEAYRTAGGASKPDDMERLRRLLLADELRNMNGPSS